MGGGLWGPPPSARRLDVFVKPEEAPEIIAGVTEIFRDSEENRQKRGRARLKFLVDAMGPEAYREELERRLGRELPRGVPTAPDLQGHDHVGVTPQLDGEHSAVGLVVPVGRLRAEQLFEIVRLSREYGRGEGRLTHQQNVLIPWVVNARVDELLAEPLLEELPANPPLFTRGL